MRGPIRAGCLGRRRRKRVKGQAGRESGTLRSASEIANMAMQPV